MSATTQLTPTQNASKEEYYASEEQTCDHCEADEFQLVGINGKYGNRKLTHACDDCLADLERAPRGLYDPVVIATLE